MPAKPTFVAIADDHTLFRKTLKNFLAEQKNIHVAVESSDICDLCDKLGRISIDVLIIEVMMAGADVHNTIKIIRNNFPSIKILVLSMNTDMVLASSILELGIYGYISKNDEPEDVVLAIQTVVENQIYRNSLLTEALYWGKQNDMKAYLHDSLFLLNEREKKILQLIWEEKSNKEIADDLFLGVRSIEKLRQDMKEKIGAKSTVGLLKYAIDRKIIEINGHSGQVRQAVYWVLLKSSNR